MTFMNYFSQFNTNISSGFNNMFSPQWSFMPEFRFTAAPTIFSKWGESFNSFSLPKFNWNSLWNNCSFSQNWNTTYNNNLWNSGTSNFTNLNSNYTTPAFNIGFDTFTRTTQPKKYSATFMGSVNTNTNLNLTSLGYNAQKGQKLAQQALSNAKGFSGHCARAVKKAIQSAGLGKYESGDAYQMTGILKRNPNFKQISANTNVNSLPAGCVLVFNQESQGYSSKYGHTEITTGTGKGISDGITNNLRKPDAIFIPV